MKIFEHDSKINFVDENNIVVGFDYYQCCCESFGWFISDEINGEKKLDNVETANEILKDFVFDSTYHECVGDESAYYTDQLAVFKLVCDEKVKYLHLYNQHNGYYSHGFDMYHGDTQLFGGSL